MKTTESSKCVAQCQINKHNLVYRMPRGWNKAWIVECKTCNLKVEL